MKNINTWDLTVMYKNNKEWEKDLNLLNERIEEFSKIDKNITKNSKYFLEKIEEYLNIQRRMYFIYKYAKLNNDADGLNSEYNKMVMSAENLMENFETKTSFVSIALKKLNKKVINSFIKETPRLKEYNHMFDEIIRNKKHVLSEKEEKILSASSNIRNGFETIFDKLDAVDSIFDSVSGKELNHSSYAILIRDKNQSIRKDAFEKYHEYYKKHSNSLSTCLINNIKNAEFIANIRGYKNARNMEMDSDKIDEKIYDNLINSIHKNIDSFYKYLDLKKKANNLNELHMYDLYLFSSKYDKKWNIDDTKEVLLNSVEILGKEYQDNYKKAFDERWIDFEYRKGKYSGAYSSGSYDSYPYILMSFNDTFRSVETLAHEMGHSMHSYFSRKNNPYHEANYPIFLAEIASNVNELLLFDYILKNTNDKEEKKYILETILESFKGSIFRQTQFAEFEHIIHTKIKNNESLSTEDITDIYYDLNKFYYGENISDDIIRYECLRVPHFYYNYYVYKYATGLSLAYVFAKRILGKEKNAVENYMKFLKSGGKDYPLNILKNSGVIMSSKVIDEGIELFNEYLKEYEELIR